VSGLGKQLNLRPVSFGCFNGPGRAMVIFVCTKLLVPDGLSTNYHPPFVSSSLTTFLGQIIILLIMPA
jgi:hypothetical protein